MHALTLNYLERPTRKSIAWAIAICAGLLAACLFQSYTRLAQEKERWEKQQSQFMQEQKRLQASAAHDDNLQNATPEQAHLDEIRRQLSVPWNGLFTILESVNFDGVALLSMQPESGSQSLMLTAEAKDLSSMLEYSRRLSKEPMLANVQLTSHQIQQQDPQKPIRFAVQGSWLTQAR